MDITYYIFEQHTFLNFLYYDREIKPLLTDMINNSFNISGNIIDLFKSGPFSYGKHYALLFYQKHTSIPIGFCMVTMSNPAYEIDHIFISYLVVNKTARGNNVCKNMMELIKVIFKEYDIYLEVFDDNTPAKNCYIHAGLKIIRTYTDKYRNNKVVHVMTLKK